MKYRSSISLIIVSSRQMGPNQIFTANADIAYDAQLRVKRRCMMYDAKKTATHLQVNSLPTTCSWRSHPSKSNSTEIFLHPMSFFILILLLLLAPIPDRCGS